MSAGLELQSDNDSVSISQLLYNANTSLLNKQKDEIIDLLGGMTNILQIYIANKHDLLSRNQQDTLSHILISCNNTEQVHHSNNLSRTTKTITTDPSHGIDPSHRTQQQSSLFNSASILDPNNITSQEQQEFKIYLHTRDDLYHKIFENQIADKITRYVLSKWALGLITILTLCFSIPISPNTSWRFILLILMSIFVLAQLFAVNLPMMRSMLFSFELGYKIFACIVIYVCSVALLTKKLQQTTAKYDLVDLHFINILNIAAVFLITNHDAWRMPIKLKIGILACLIAMYIYFWGLAFFCEDLFLGIEYDDILWKVPLLGQYLSLRGLFISSISNLIIFFCKQEWNMIRHKNKSSIYALRPSIQWIIDWQQFGKQLSDLDIDKYHTINA